MLSCSYNTTIAPTIPFVKDKLKHLQYLYNWYVIIETIQGISSANSNLKARFGLRQPVVPIYPNLILGDLYAGYFYRVV